MPFKVSFIVQYFSNFQKVRVFIYQNLHLSIFSLLHFFKAMIKVLLMHYLINLIEVLMVTLVIVKKKQDLHVFILHFTKIKLIL